MNQQAVISNVTSRQAGSALAAPLIGGEVALELEATDDFPETGGELTIAPDDENVETLTFIAVDDATGEIMLDPSTPVLNPWDAGTMVRLTPASLETEVACYLDGQDDGDPLIAHLPHGLEPLLREGTRDPGLGESILVTQRGLEWIVVDVLGERPIVQTGGILWGGETDDLIGFGLDPDGEQNAELSAANPGFATLYIGDLDSPTVPRFGADDLTFYVDPDNGDDDLNDGTALLPLQSITEAVSRIPKFNEGECTIFVVSGSIVTEGIVLDSFVGSGSLTIDFVSNATTSLIGSILVDGCSMDLFFKNATITDDAASGGTGADDGSGDPQATIWVRNSRLFTLDTCKVYTLGARTWSLGGSAANVVALSSEFHGGTSDAILATRTANINAVGCSGNSQAGNAMRCNGSSIRLGGTRVAGTLVETNGGRITDDSTSSAAGGGSGSSTKHTRYWSTTSTGSWRDAFGGQWRDDNDDVYEGSYGLGNHRGCWFYDVSNLRSVLSGKHIDAAYLYVARRAAGGQSGKIGIRLWTHDRTSKSGQPNLAADVVIGSLAWGGKGWIKIPTSMIERIRDNTNGARGLALYQPSGSPYGIFAGRSAIAASGRLKITYH